MLHHVDVHVRDVAAARALFDAIAPHVGYRRRDDEEADFVGYETESGGRPRVGFILEPSDVAAGSMRLAFSVASRDEVDAAARAASQCGARAMEGPGLHPEYGDYYAVFFEDADGNRFEVLTPPP